VAAALIHLSDLTGFAPYLQHGGKNLDWILSQQMGNGFFKSCAFDAREYPFLHTMIYVLEGLIDSWKITGSQRIQDSFLKYSNLLKEINLTRDLILYSQYDYDLKPVNRERCITGLAQWAGICLDLFGMTGDSDYYDLAVRNLYYLKSKQMKWGANCAGGFTGSIPFYGKYGTLQLLNWNAKYFIDAMMKYELIPLSLPDEHQKWVSGCFSVHSDIVSDDFSPVDEKYLRLIVDHLEPLKDKSLTLVDLGCGKGKYLDSLKIFFPNCTLIGIDPHFTNPDKNIINGSTESTNLSECSADIIMLIEVLQHVKYLDRSFKELRRILKPGGLLIIGERNPVSVTGILKPVLERAGRWMYPPDSPFREKWYSYNRWKACLMMNGFILKSRHNISCTKSLLPFTHRYSLFFCEKAKSE
jgi:SAM-dependent methyltransferase